MLDACRTQKGCQDRGFYSEILRRGAPTDFVNPAEPTGAMTVTQYGVTAFGVRYGGGSARVTVPGGSAHGNNRVRRTFRFAPPTTDRVRVPVNNAPAGYSRLTEVEVD